LNTPIYIAKRYLFSTKKMHAINIISGISMLGILIGTGALIILLSVFNGLESTILNMYSNFSPEIRVTPKMGKTFDPNTLQFQGIHKDVRVFSYTEVLEDKVVVQYNDKTFIANIRGVSDEFLKNPRLDSIIQDGSFTLHLDNRPLAVLGAIVKNNLSINIHDEMRSLRIYAPRRGNGISLNPGDEFISRNINTAGAFAVQQEFDDLVIVPIEFTRDLFEESSGVSYIDLNYKPGTDLATIQTDIESKLGSQFIVKSRRQQNTALYQTLNFEKWAMFMILAFVVIIAAFNIVGSLTMLVMEKRKDIAILTSLGANKQLIQRIFFFEGLMISFIGCAIGIVLGLVFCILQQRYGLVKVNESLGVANNAYPIDIRYSDFIEVFLTVMLISVVASGISARLSVKSLDDIKQDL
jgi:lipoprotein-releasing system permease protein